jgi:mono/diheme cytochrome c family protein
MRGAFRRVGVGLIGGLAVAVGGCELKDSGDNLVAGKQAFVERCGSCHVLQRAGTTGVTGPNLDEAFQQARRDGLGESTFKGVVRAQILYPARTPQLDPKTGRPLSAMPANLVTGERAEDVAAYVAAVAGVRGEDQGQLGEIGVRRSEEVAVARDGALLIPADPGGGLVYEFGAARAEAGPLTIRSPNESSVDHNIALEGNGVDATGPVVKDGGVSEIEVDVEPGRYTFFCSVPGHREGGMEGPLTVE